MTNHSFVLLGDIDIYTLDTLAERIDAREAMREAGIDQLPIFQGPAGEEGTATGEMLQAVVEPPSDEELAQLLMVLVNPESDESDREAVIEQITAVGRVDVVDFSGACILTDNAGFVLTIGSTKFHVTVVS